MPSRAFAILIIIALAGCTAPPAETPKHEHGATPEQRQKILAGFRDLTCAQYDAILALERGERDERALDEQKKAEAETRGRLIAALETAGWDEARTKPLGPLVRESALRGGRFAFVEEPGDPPSFEIVRVLRRRTARLELETEFSYELVVHDETVVPDLATYRASRAKAGPGVARLALTAGRTIYIDRAAIERLGRDVFLPRADALRELAAAARDDAPFLALAKDTPRLVALAKDALRWRSLEPLWATIRSFPKDEQVDRFSNDYEAREEVRAAIEARELELAHSEDPSEPTAERIAAIERRAQLMAIVHGEALGETANALGLAAAALARPRGQVPPNLAAAASVAADLARVFATKETSVEVADARAFARLARATPDDLRAAARALLGPKQPPRPKTP